METTLKNEKKLLAWSSTPEDIEIVRSEGSYLYDADGERYIDFIMGWCVGSFGWGNKKISSALHEFSGPEYVYPAFVYKGWLELAALLADITPGNLGKSFRETGGTDSVETAMKIAMIYTGRKNFLSVEGCYHGNSIAALSIGSSSNYETYPNLLSGCHKIHRPLDENAAKEVEKWLKNEDIAAFILEPVLTHPGVHVPDKNFMLTIQDLCRKYKTLLVMDEVATGFGRTGKLFGSEHYGLEPDVMCFAKAITGGYAALGAAITTEKIGKAVEGKINAFPTYGWHPVSVQAALASIHHLLDNKKEIFKNVEEVGALIHSRISAMKFKKGLSINMLGLAIGVDVKDSSYALEIAEKCLKSGLIIETHGNNLMLFPALNMPARVAREGLDILEECV